MWLIKNFTLGYENVSGEVYIDLSYGSLNYELYHGAIFLNNSNLTVSSEMVQTCSGIKFSKIHN